MRETMCKGWSFKLLGFGAGDGCIFSPGLNMGSRLKTFDTLGLRRSCRESALMSNEVKEDFILDTACL